MAETRRQKEQAIAALLNRSIKAGEQRGLERALLAAASYVLGREVDDAARELARSGPETALRALAIAARETWPKRWKQVLEPMLMAVAGYAMENKAPLPSFSVTNPRMASWLDGYTSELAGNLSNTSYENFKRTLGDALNDGLSVPNTTKLLRDRLPELNASRARLIAQNELHRSSVEASHLQIKESGVPIRGKIWRSAGDHRVRPAHRTLDGVTVGLDEPFPNGAQTPGTEIGCRCVLTYDVAVEKLRNSA